MKVLTWNLGYWQFSRHHDKAWSYLCNDIKPDLALLQEVKPPPWISPDDLVFEEIRAGWGTAIYSPSLVLSKGLFQIYPGRVAVATTTLNDELTLFVASIHAPIIENRVFPHLTNIFSELESIQSGPSALIGGDLNSARLAEKVWPGYVCRPALILGNLPS